MVIETTGIPNYVVTITQDMIDFLEARNQQNSDYSSNGHSVSVGEVIQFGSDIGYDGQCETNLGYGYWPPGPTCPENVDKTGYFPISTTAADEDCEAGLGVMGYAINGVSIYNWGDGQSYNSEGTWQSLAPFAESTDVDLCGGHAAEGDYHHHFYSDCWAVTAGDQASGHSPVYGFSADGYPVYGPWHDTNTPAVSCWKSRDYSASSTTGCGSEGVRSCVMVDAFDPTQGTTSEDNNGPTTSGSYTNLSGNTFDTPAGFFYEDYYFDPNCPAQGDRYLDEHNGHDHGDLGYHYHVTATVADDIYTPSFPFTYGPNFAGTLDDNGVTTCGGTSVGGGSGGAQQDGGPGGP